MGREGTVYCGSSIYVSWQVIVIIFGRYVAAAFCVFFFSEYYEFFLAKGAQRGASVQALVDGKLRD